MTIATLPQALKDTFAVRSEERPMMIAVMAVLACFQYLMIAKFFPQFAHYDEQQWNVFMRNFHMSGFDPFAYKILTDWYPGYDSLRHPLLAIGMYPLYLLNRLLWLITGANCCQLIMGALLWTCSGYTFLWLHRTLAHAIGIGRWRAMLLSTFFFGLAYVLLGTFVPDHFGLSLSLLVLTVYRAAVKMSRRATFSMAEAALLFTATAGVTLTNGVSVFLIIAVTNGCAVLRPRYLARAFVLPSLLLFGIAMATSHNAQQARPDLMAPIGEQTKWLRSDVARMDVTVENFFGESLQLHRKHILGDVLVHRPVIVRYHTPLQYAAEALIVLLFAVGCVAGRRERLLWAVLAVTAFNVLLHLVVGFAIDEVHIMAAHWAFCLPIAMAFLLKSKCLKTTIPTVSSLLVLTVYLWTYHGILLYNYLTWPVR